MGERKREKWAESVSLIKNKKGIGAFQTRARTNQLMQPLGTRLPPGCECLFLTLSPRDGFN